MYLALVRAMAPGAAPLLRTPASLDAARRYIRDLEYEWVQAGTQEVAHVLVEQVLQLQRQTLGDEAFRHKWGGVDSSSNDTLCDQVVEYVFS
jgi:hypothetical protein